MVVVKQVSLIFQRQFLSLKTLKKHGFVHKFMHVAFYILFYLKILEINIFCFVYHLSQIR